MRSITSPKQLDRSWVDPLGVLEDHEHRALPGEALHLTEQRLEGPELLRFRCQVHGRVARAGRNGEQRRDQRRNRGDAFVRLSEHRFELVESGVYGVFCLEAGGAFHLVDHGEERAVGVVGRAVVA